MNSPAVIPPSPRYSPSKVELKADVERLEKYNDYYYERLVLALDCADKVSANNEKLRAENKKMKSDLDAKDGEIEHLRAALHAMGGSGS